MAVVGTCAICSAPAVVTCSMCGRAVCGEHLVEGTDVCIHCGIKTDGGSMREAVYR